VQVTTWQTNATEKIEWCPMCPLWWKSSCELQGMYVYKETYPPLQRYTPPA
jgi:hypothetical protein